MAGASGRRSVSSRLPNLTGSASRVCAAQPPKTLQTQRRQATFSGAIEFPIGNVGRDAGTLVFKGKFDSANSISGKVSFFRAGQDLKNSATIPAKTGDFTAKRATTS